LIEENELSGRELAETALRLLTDRPLLARMGEAARAFARPDAARLLADLLFEAEETGRRRP